MTDKEKEQKKLERKATEFLRKNGSQKKHKRHKQNNKSFERIRWMLPEKK